MPSAVLLDAVDTRRRILQNALIVGGVMLLFMALVVFNAAPDEKRSIGGWTTMVLGLAALTGAFRVKVRWSLDYHGHVIVFENDPIQGERLFVDGAPAAKGTFGVHNVMTASLPNGQRLRATTTAGLVSFHCRITVDGNAPPSSAPSVAFE